MFHYIVGARIDGFNSPNPVEKSLDFFFEYTDQDYKKWKDAHDASKNELWKTKVDEALNIFGAQPLHQIFNAVSIRSRCENLMVLHYECEFELDREDFDTYIKVSSIKELEKARIQI